MGFTSDIKKNTGSKDSDPDQVQAAQAEPAQVIQDAAGHAHAQDKTGSAADAANAPDAPDAADVLTLSDGTQVICGRDAKGRRTVPDEIMAEYYKELPARTFSESGLYQANGSGGRLRMLGVDKEIDRAIQEKGAAVLNATHAQRRAMSETIDIMLKSAAGKEEIERFNLPAGATKQDAIMAALYAEVIDKGTVRAADFLRDTVGEQPVNRQQIEADIMTQADKALMERIEKRLGIGK